MDQDPWSPPWTLSHSIQLAAFDSPTSSHVPKQDYPNSSTISQQGPHPNAHKTLAKPSASLDAADQKIQNSSWTPSQCLNLDAFNSPTTSSWVHVPKQDAPKPSSKFLQGADTNAHNTPTNPNNTNDPIHTPSNFPLGPIEKFFALRHGLRLYKLRDNATFKCVQCDNETTSMRVAYREDDEGDLGDAYCEWCYKKGSSSREKGTKALTWGPEGWR